MNIYLDESYDNGRTILIIGALFDGTRSDLNKKFREIKIKANFITPGGELRELKYNKINDERKLRLSKEAIEAFQSSTSYFRASVLFTTPESGFNLDIYGSPWERNSLKMARLYKKVTESTVIYNLGELLEPTYSLWLDSMTRCKGDELVKVLREEYGRKISTEGGDLVSGKKRQIFANINEVDSKNESYHLIQICDLLCGCIFADHFPPPTRFKNEFRDFSAKILRVPGFTKGYWGRDQQSRIPWEVKNKFRINYYEWRK